MINTYSCLVLSHLGKSFDWPTSLHGPVLLLRHDAVARILANGSATFIECCAAIG